MSPTTSAVLTVLTLVLGASAAFLGGLFLIGCGHPWVGAGGLFIAAFQAFCAGTTGGSAGAEDEEDDWDDTEEDA